jgi:hypothetical protein
MTDSLTVMGTFLMGAATGSLVTWLKQRHLIAECRKLLERIPQNPQLSAEASPKFGMKALVVSPDIGNDQSVLGPISRKAN